MNKNKSHKSVDLNEVENDQINRNNIDMKPQEIGKPSHNRDKTVERDDRLIKEPNKLFETVEKNDNIKSMPTARSYKIANTHTLGQQGKVGTSGSRGLSMKLNMEATPANMLLNYKNQTFNLSKQQHLHKNKDNDNKVYHYEAFDNKDLDRRDKRIHARKPSRLSNPLESLNRSNPVDSHHIQNYKDYQAVSLFETFKSQHDNQSIQPEHYQIAPIQNSKSHHHLWRQPQGGNFSVKRAEDRGRVRRVRGKIDGMNMSVRLNSNDNDNDNYNDVEHVYADRSGTDGDNDRAILHNFSKNDRLATLHTEAYGVLGSNAHPRNGHIKGLSFGPNISIKGKKNNLGKDFYNNNAKEDFKYQDFDSENLQYTYANITSSIGWSRKINEIKKTDYYDDEEFNTDKKSTQRNIWLKTSGGQIFSQNNIGSESLEKRPGGLVEYSISKLENNKTTIDLNKPYPQLSALEKFKIPVKRKNKSIQVNIDTLGLRKNGKECPCKSHRNVNRVFQRSTAYGQALAPNGSNQNSCTKISTKDNALKGASSTMLNFFMWWTWENDYNDGVSHKKTKTLEPAKPLNEGRSTAKLIGSQIFEVEKDENENVEDDKNRNKSKDISGKLYPTRNNNLQIYSRIQGFPNGKQNQKWVGVDFLTGGEIEDEFGEELPFMATYSRSQKDIKGYQNNSKNKANITVTNKNFRNNGGLNLAQLRLSEKIIESRVLNISKDGSTTDRVRLNNMNNQSKDSHEIINNSINVSKNIAPYRIANNFSSYKNLRPNKNSSVEDIEKVSSINNSKQRNAHRREISYSKNTFKPWILDIEKKDFLMDLKLKEIQLKNNISYCKSYIQKNKVFQEKAEKVTDRLSSKHQSVEMTGSNFRKTGLDHKFFQPDTKEEMAQTSGKSAFGATNELLQRQYSKIEHMIEENVKAYAKELRKKEKFGKIMPSKLLASDETAYTKLNPPKIVDDVLSRRLMKKGNKEKFTLKNITSRSGIQSIEWNDVADTVVNTGNDKGQNGTLFNKINNKIRLKDAQPVINSLSKEDEDDENLVELKQIDLSIELEIPMETQEDMDFSSTIQKIKNFRRSEKGISKYAGLKNPPEFRLTSDKTALEEMEHLKELRKKGLLVKYPKSVAIVNEDYFDYYYEQRNVMTKMERYLKHSFRFRISIEKLYQKLFFKNLLLYILSKEQAALSDDQDTESIEETREKAIKHIEFSSKISLMSNEKYYDEPSFKTIISHIKTQKERMMKKTLTITNGDPGSRMNTSLSIIKKGLTNKVRRQCYFSYWNDQITDLLNINLRSTLPFMDIGYYSTSRMPLMNLDDNFKWENYPTNNPYPDEVFNDQSYMCDKIYNSKVYEKKQELYKNRSIDDLYFIPTLEARLSDNLGDDDPEKEVIRRRNHRTSVGHNSKKFARHESHLKVLSIIGSKLENENMTITQVMHKMVDKIGRDLAEEDLKFNFGRPFKNTLRRTMDKKLIENWLRSSKK